MSIITDLIPINTPALTDSAPAPLFIWAAPGTDLWRKPPNLDLFNAPAYVHNFPAASFLRARVTVSAEWKRQYDQGGLVLFLPSYPAHKLWIKAGVEYHEGQLCASVVAARDAADWSLLPTSGQGTVTLEIEREKIDEVKGTGSSLWVYLVQDGKRTAIREVTWAFKEKADLEGQISIGIYAARPTKEGPLDAERLVVKFEDLGITKQ